MPGLLLQRLLALLQDTFPYAQPHPMQIFLSKQMDSLHLMENGVVAANRHNG